MQNEIMLVRRKKERAIENQSFEQAARLRELEGRLIKLARAADHEAFWELVGREPPARQPPTVLVAEPPVIEAERWTLRAVSAGWAILRVCLRLYFTIGHAVMCR